MPQAAQRIVSSTSLSAPKRIPAGPRSHRGEFGRVHLSTRNGLLEEVAMATSAAPTPSHGMGALDA
ncbi:MAG: hypothetical protein A2Y55_11075 [Actinobacteria bacterium RBG_16_68_12]|nr:MAG: hypothetical protein A2Y55_11075 [Actinobacteria bacterium RBG_16_68_12]